MAKKEVKNLEVKVNMEDVLKGIKVLVKEKKQDVILRTALGVEKALPEIKAIGRNVVIHIGLEAGKAVTEAIVGQNDLVDKVIDAAHGTVATNTAYNTVMGVHHFRKGYKKATQEKADKLINKYVAAASRYEDEDDDDDTL